MLRRVPVVTSRWCGTMAVRVPSSVYLTNLTWLPFWLTSVKPTASNLRWTSRYGRGLSDTDFHLNAAHVWCDGGARWFEVQFQGLAQVRQRLFFCFPLAGNIHFQALGNKPVALLPYTGGKGSLHTLCSFRLLPFAFFSSPHPSAPASERTPGSPPPRSPRPLRAGSRG